jgi:trk system potassium uptake protein TrkA
MLRAPLKDLKLPDACVIAAVIRRGKVLVPRGNMAFEVADEVLAVVNNAAVPALRALFAPS